MILFWEKGGAMWGWMLKDVDRSFFHKCFSKLCDGWLVAVRFEDEILFDEGGE